MTFIGEMLGYDHFGGDLLGINRDENSNCIVCGRSVYHHSEKSEQDCFIELSREMRRQRLAYYRAKYPKL